MVSFLSAEKKGENRPAILTRIAQDDKSAVCECVDRYGNIIWALAKQGTTSAADAEKAASEIFTDIWQYAAFCDLEISEESVWIVLIARRRLSNYLLKNDNQPTPEISKDVFTSEYDKSRKSVIAAQ